MDPAKWGREQPAIIRCDECGQELHLQKQRAIGLCPLCAVDVLARHPAVVPVLKLPAGPRLKIDSRCPPSTVLLVQDGKVVGAIDHIEP